MKLRILSVVGIVVALGAIALYTGSQSPQEPLGDTVSTLDAWRVVSGNITPRNAINGLRVPSLVSCNTIDTDGNGVFSCGTDEGGSGGSWSTSTADYWATTDLKLQELSDVQDPSAWGQLLMWTGSVWSTTSTSSLGIVGASDGNWSTTSADHWETLQTARTADDLSDNTTSDLAEGTNLYWTSARATSAVSALIAATTTTAIDEGTNLYYTDLRVGDYITGSTTLCVFLTGSADLCDGVDASGTGGTGLATSTAIADTYVIYGTAPGTVGAESAFTYDDALDKLTVVNASTTYTTATTFFGNLTGLASLATALNANGSNCSAGSFPLGVNASGAVEDCTDAWTESENTSASYISRSGVSATYPISYNNGTGVFSWLGLSTSSAPTIGGLPYWTSSTALGNVATGTLTENVTGLEFNATGNLVGSAAILGITTGYGIPLTASTTNWNSFYDTPSGRITAGDGLTWSVNTLNFDGGNTPAGALGGTWASPTVDDDGHNHTSASISGIDISADTNLAVTYPVLRTDDTLSLAFGTTTANNWSLLQNFTTASATNFSVVTGIDLFGGARVTTANALCIQLTGSAELCDGTDATGGTATVYLASTTPWTAGQLATVVDNGTLNSVATGTLTENITGLEFSATGNLVGSAAVLNLTSGYSMFLTASGTNWNTFYDTPSNRITGGNGLTWSGNTLNFDGGDTPGGELGGTWASPTLDANALSLEELSDVNDTITETLGDLLYWTGTQWSDIATSTLNISTTNIVEGTKLFYTDARVGTYLYGSTTRADLYTAGNGLTWSGTTINFDGGDAPGGELGGTWASPTLDAEALGLEELSDVGAMTKNFGDLLYWNGSAWADIATSSLGISGGGTPVASSTWVQFTGGVTSADGAATFKLKDTGQDYLIIATGECDVSGSGSNAITLNVNGVPGTTHTFNADTNSQDNSFTMTYASTTATTTTLQLTLTRGGNCTSLVNVDYSFVAFDPSVGGLAGAGITGGTAGLLASWVSATELTSTTSPSAGTFTATSTTATSTFPLASVTTAFNFLGDYITNVLTWFDTKIEALTAVVLQGTWDFGGATSIEVVNGTAPTVDTAGEIALDTTDDQLLMADGGNTVRVMATDEWRVISTTIASTSVAFASGQTLPALSFKDGLEITQYRCYVVGGTSKIVNLTDGTNDTETITCGTTITSDTDVATNDTFTADELGYIEMGATSGTVNYLHFEAWARVTRE